MKKEDEDKTSFTTPFGTYCYTRMPKGLKNVGATFARMTKEVLGSQLDRNIIAYVDNIVVMSKNKNDHVSDLQETFANLRTAGLRLTQRNAYLESQKGRCSVIS